MKFVKLTLMGNFLSYDACSSVEMCNLGLFLTDDAGEDTSSFKEWLTDDSDISTCSNATALEKENGFILIRDLYSEEKVPTKLKLTYNQFFEILNDWEEKVLTLQPKEVIIKLDNEQFVFETKND